MPKRQELWEKSIVKVINKGTNIDFANPFRPNEPSDESQGTAYYISPHVLVTCYHVVADAQQLLIQVDNDNIVNNHRAWVVYACPNIDLALLYTHAEAVPLTVAAEDKIEPDDPLVGRGYPLGAPKLNTNRGVVSRYEDHLLVVDTPQNPGNSGGPQFDKRDQVVSTCKAGKLKANNMSYGVLSYYTRLAVSEFLSAVSQEFVSLEHDWARHYSPDVLDSAASSQIHKKSDPVLVLRPSEDFLMQRGNEMLLGSRGLPPEPDQRPLQGVLVTKIIKHSPADKAGLRVGDLLLAIDGKKLSSDGFVLGYPEKNKTAKLKTYVKNGRAGQGITLDVLPKSEKLKKNKTVKTVKTVLSSARERAIKGVFAESDDIDFEVFAGLVFENLTQNHGDPDLARELKFMPTTELAAALNFENWNTPRLLVVNVLPMSFFACKHTVFPGFLVDAVNDIPVFDLESLRKALTQVIKDKTQEYIVFSLATGGEAVIHKVVAAKQDPGMREMHGYEKSTLMDLLEQNTKGMKFVSSVAD